MYTYIPKYIDRKQLLASLDQEKVACELLGLERIVLGETILSPIRPDHKPSCSFGYTSKDHVLYLKDFSTGETYSLIKLYQMINNTTYYQTLQDLYLISKSGVVNTKKQECLVKKEGYKTKLKITPTVFTKYHAEYFKRFDITKKQLEQDGILAFNYYELEYGFTGEMRTYYFPPESASYAIPFGNDYYKLVFPYKKDYRFITNTNSDIIREPNYTSSTLIISKSYKDYRVLANLGVESTWVQSETSIPSKEILKPIFDNYQRIVIWFDNDKAGIESMRKNKDFFQSLHSNVEIYEMPYYNSSVTDPADLYEFNSDELKHIIFVNKFNK